MINKTFLYICTLIALFITLSGLASVQHASDVVSHLFFVPITLYLVITSALQIKSPRKTIAAPLTAYMMTVGSITFLLLIIIIARMVSIFMMPV